MPTNWSQSPEATCATRAAFWSMPTNLSQNLGTTCDRDASVEMPLSRYLCRDASVELPHSRCLCRDASVEMPLSILQTRQSAHGTSLWHLTADGSELGRCRVEPPGEHWNPSGANTGIHGFAAHGFLYHGVGYHRIGYHGFAAHGIGYHGAPARLRVTPGRPPTETPARHPPG